MSKKTIKEQLEEWATLQAEIKAAAGEKNKALEPFIAQHNKKTAPILAAYDEKAGPLIKQAAAIEAEIAAGLKSKLDKDGNPKLAAISSENASATLTKTEGKRVVSVEKFFSSVKEKTAEFWACLAIGVASAEKLLGKSKLDEISTKKTSYDVQISLNK